MGNGYDHTLLRESRHPTRRELRPRQLRSIPSCSGTSRGTAWSPTPKTLRASRHHGEDAGPRGVGASGREKDGEPNGVLWEWAQHLDPGAPARSGTRRHTALPRNNASAEYLAAGVTSVVDAAIGFNYGMRDAEITRRWPDEGGLPLRVRGCPSCTTLWRELRDGAGPGLEWPGDPDRVRPLAVKFFQDGSIQIQERGPARTIPTGRPSRRTTT